MKYFDTHSVPPAHRHDYWKSLVATSFTALDVRPDDYHNLNCQVGWQNIGQTRILSVSGSSQTVCRTSASIKADSAPYIILMFQEHGTGTLLHNGKSVSLQPGTVVAMDTRSPYRLRFVEQFKQYVVRFPTEHFELAGLCTSAFTATILRPGFASQLLRNGLFKATQPDTLLHDCTEQLLLELATLTLAGHTADHSNTGTARLLQAKNYIASNLRSPNLSAATVANALGISLRTLQLAFIEAGETPSAFIRNRRLEQIKRALNKPSLLHRPIWQIAQSWGFSDPSHFSRAFRQHFQMSARDWRQQARQLALQTPENQTH